jgi:hypothetical protein
MRIVRHGFITSLIETGSWDRALIGAELGARLGVTDIDGSVPLILSLGGPPELHATLTSDGC